jgi:hypothetical protein
VDGEEFTLAVSTSSDSAALFHRGKRVDCGHIDDVRERLIDRLGVCTEYVPSVVVDIAKSGWLGVASNIEELGL